MDYTLKKEERLSKKKLIKEVFDKGDSCINYPLKLYWTKEKNNDDIYGRLAVAVSKRNFKKAVDRNQIKRHIREAYRKNKSIIKNNNCLYNIVILYVSKELNDYDLIESKLMLLLQEIIKEKNS